MPPEVADAAWGSAASGQQRKGHNKMPRTHDKSKIGHPKKRSRRAYSAEALSRHRDKMKDRWDAEVKQLELQFGENWRETHQVCETDGKEICPGVEPGWMICMLCKVKLIGPGTAWSHFESRRHKNNLEWKCKRDRLPAGLSQGAWVPAPSCPPAPAPPPLPRGLAVIRSAPGPPTTVDTTAKIEKAQRPPEYGDTPPPVITGTPTWEHAAAGPAGGLPLGPPSRDAPGHLGPPLVIELGPPPPPGPPPLYRGLPGWQAEKDE